MWYRIIYVYLNHNTYYIFICFSCCEVNYVRHGYTPSTPCTTCTPCTPCTPCNPCACIVVTQAMANNNTIIGTLRSVNHVPWVIVLIDLQVQQDTWRFGRWRENGAKSTERRSQEERDKEGERERDRKWERTREKEKKRKRARRI